MATSPGVLQDRLNKPGSGSDPEAHGTRVQTAERLRLVAGRHFRKQEVLE